MTELAEVIRILVVDDHPVVREGLAAMLATQPDFDVVGEASSGQEALQLAAARQPEVICLDLEMPDMDGVAVLQALRESGSAARVIVFTAYDTDERILAAVRSGARGYILKGAPRDQIFQAVRVVHSGGSLLEPAVASRLMDHLAGAAPAQTELPDPLTERELEVLELLAQGLTNREIAEKLVVTERTAKFHVSAILRKLGVDNRTEAVSVAAQMGLVQF